MHITYPVNGENCMEIAPKLTKLLQFVCPHIYAYFRQNEGHYDFASPTIVVV